MSAHIHSLYCICSILCHLSYIFLLIQLCSTVNSLALGFESSLVAWQLRLQCTVGTQMFLQSPCLREQGRQFCSHLGTLKLPLFSTKVLWPYQHPSTSSHPNLWVLPVLAGLFMGAAWTHRKNWWLQNSCPALYQQWDSGRASAGSSRVVLAKVALVQQEPDPGLAVTSALWFVHVMETCFKITKFLPFTMMIKFSMLRAVLTQGINLYILTCFVGVDAERQKPCKNQQ